MTLDDRPTTRRLLRLSPSRGGGTGQSLLAVRNCRPNNDSRPARYARRLSPHARPRRRALYPVSLGSVKYARDLPSVSVPFAQEEPDLHFRLVHEVVESEVSQFDIEATL